MRIQKINFFNNPNIGLFAFSTDKFCVTDRYFKKGYHKTMEDTLKVPLIKTRMMGTPLAGIFAAGNSKGVIVSGRIQEKEIGELKKQTKVLVLKTRFSAMGNMILANDKGCVISKELSKNREKIGDFLGVKTEVGTISGNDLVGSLGIANNKGCLVHKMVTEEEIETLKSILKVNVDVGSVNLGNPWIRSGIIVNSNGLLIGDRSSGPELGIITETLGFV